MAGVCTKLRLLWAAVAVHSPLLLASKWGQQGLLELLEDKLLSWGRTKESYYTAQHVAAIFKAYR